MFALLSSARDHVLQFHQDVDLDALTPAEARAAIEEHAAIEKAAASGRLRLLRLVENDHDTVDWLSKETGQSKAEARRDLQAASQVREATDRALRDGELSADQAREVASAADADPTAERELLDSARNESLAELRRRAKRIRAAATDDEEKAKRAQAERDVRSRSDDETGKGHINISGPGGQVGEMLTLLEPFIQARFEAARQAGEHERRGAYAFDALLDALRLAADRRIGHTDTPSPGAAVKMLVRVDAAALRRGHTIAGETCEIDGLGPVPVAALREYLPDAAIYLICTNGRDVWNITNLARGTNAHQQIVLEWLGLECARQGCGATRNLQIDHRVEWAKDKVTELANLDPLCPADHHRKTYNGWALVPGRGRRRMVPPDHPDHPANSPPANSPPANAPPAAAA